MKLNLKLTLCLIGLAALALLTGARYSAVSSYSVLRAEADENSSLIDLTTEGDFDQRPAGARRIRDNGKSLQAIFCGGAAADKTFAYKIYAWRADNGPCELLAYGTGVLGTQAVVKYPSGGDATNKFWADTLTITYQGMPEMFYLADNEGNNRVAKMYGNLSRYEWIYAEITAADGATGDEAGDVSVYFTLFD